MKISIIAALADNYIIGINNKLPWHLPADLQHFKAITVGKPVIMGRRTFESIGKPLPQRRNIVISRNKNWHRPECEVYSSLFEALEQLKDYDEIMIIGGAEIYKQVLPIADRMYLTFIHHTFKGDTYFPKWNPKEWQEIERKDFTADKKNPYPYSFVILERRKSA